MNHGRMSAAVLACAAFAGALLAQEWSPAQKEVWSQVEVCWQAYAKEDLEGFMACIDDDYLGWNTYNALPHDKAHWRKYTLIHFESTDRVIWHIDPVGIKIHGDIAFVHFYYHIRTHGKDGTGKGEKGRWTYILKKKGQRWLLIGDQGGADPAT
jgi:ketosteroid isomerase-like protein